MRRAAQHGRLTSPRHSSTFTPMRGGVLILATLIVATAPARAADVLTQPSPSSMSAASATLAAWPGFEIRRTEAVAALAWPRAATTAPSVAPGITAPTCVGQLAAAVGTTSPMRECYLLLIRAAECRYHLPQGLLASLIGAESAYKVRTRSRVGAVGRLYHGRREVGITDRLDPARSIEGGASYLGRMIERFATVPLALAAYNAGPGAVARAGGIPHNTETPTYVARMMLAWDASIPSADDIAPAETSDR